VQSAAGQYGDEFEVVIVDDGSESGHSLAYETLVARYNNVRLHRLAQTERGHGPSFARNMGAWLSESRYIAFLDDDDLWLDPEHLLRARQAIEAADEPDLYYTNQVAFVDSEPVSDELWVGALAKHTRRLTPVGDDAYLVSLEQLFQYATGFSHLNTTIVSRRLFNRVRGFDTGLRYEPDRDFALRSVSAANYIVYRPAVVARHNVPNPTRLDNVSTNSTPIEKCLNQLYFLNKAICFSRPVVVRYAVKHRMYTLKRLTELLAAEGDFRNAVRFAREALGIEFGLKWAAYCIYLQFRSAGAPLYVPRTGKWYGTAD
ncbi:MAG: glycosyltransferase, partial [Acetobacteraceae bacterium]|nr:glycosyltransferase [Acetobacteraceae bacterium]